MRCQNDRAFYEGDFRSAVKKGLFHFRIALTIEEYRWILDKSKTHSISTSKLLRQAVLKEMAEEEIKGFEKLVYEDRQIRLFS